MLHAVSEDMRQHEFEDDMIGQSMGTTLRTEIYSSEDEYEMVNLYTYLSHKKAHNILLD